MTTPARVTGRRQPRRLWCNYFLLSRGPQSALPAFRPVLCGPQSCARLHPDDIASLERLAVARLAEHPSSADGLRPRLPKALSAGGPAPSVSPSSSSSPSCVRATISSFLKDIISPGTHRDKNRAAIDQHGHRHGPRLAPAHHTMRQIRVGRRQGPAAEVDVELVIKLFELISAAAWRSLPQALGLQLN